MLRIILNLTLLCFLKVLAQEVVQRQFEFEDVTKETERDLWVWRSEASGLKTLRLVDEKGKSSVQFTLCVRPNDPKETVAVFVEDLRYCNDGPPDRIKLRFEGIDIARFTTFEKWHSGHEWNVFRNTGRIGPLIRLRQGDFSLNVIVLTDMWGVELDMIKISAINQRPDVDIVCRADLYAP
jgi:hypothetical protein